MLTFSALRKANSERCRTAFPQCGSWSITDWACALAGEVGEACNVIKKIRRGDRVQHDLAKELADIVIYADLLAEKLGIDLEAVVIEKFNEVSDRRQSDIKL